MSVLNSISNALITARVYITNLKCFSAVMSSFSVISFVSFLYFIYSARFVEVQTGQFRFYRDRALYSFIASMVFNLLSSRILSRQFDIKTGLIRSLGLIPIIVFAVPLYMELMKLDTVDFYSYRYFMALIIILNILLSDVVVVINHTEDYPLTPNF